MLGSWAAGEATKGISGNGYGSHLGRSFYSAAGGNAGNIFGEYAAMQAYGQSDERYKAAITPQFSTITNMLIGSSIQKYKGDLANDSSIDPGFLLALREAQKANERDQERRMAELFEGWAFWRDEEARGNQNRSQIGGNQIIEREIQRWMDQGMTREGAIAQVISGQEDAAGSRNNSAAMAGEMSDMEAVEALVQIAKKQGINLKGVGSKESLQRIMQRDAAHKWESMNPVQKELLRRKGSGYNRSHVSNTEVRVENGEIVVIKDQKKYDDWKSQQVETYIPQRPSSQSTPQQQTIGPGNGLSNWLPPIENSPTWEPEKLKFYDPEIAITTRFLINKVENWFDKNLETVFFKASFSVPIYNLSWHIGVGSTLDCTLEKVIGSCCLLQVESSVPSALAIRGSADISTLSGINASVRVRPLTLDTEQRALRSAMFGGSRPSGESMPIDE